MIKPIKPEKLKGDALLSRLNEVQHLSRNQQAKACGYVTPRGNAQLLKFFEAVSSAGGIIPEAFRTRGRQPDYTGSIHSSGMIQLNQFYARQIGLSKKGDRYKIEVAEGCIKIIPIVD